MAFLAPYAAPIAGALIGGLTGYATSPEDNKFGGTITGALLGGTSGGIIGAGSKLLGLGATAAEGATASNAGRIASGWNPVELAKSAYTGEGGLFNAAVDFGPMAMDAANGNFGLHSLTGLAATGISTKFGSTGLNSRGMNALEKGKNNINQNLGSLESQRMMSGAEALSDDYKDSYLKAGIGDITQNLMSQKDMTRKNPNFALGMGLNVAGYSALSAFDTPKLEAQHQQYNPVSSYIGAMQNNPQMRAE